MTKRYTLEKTEKILAHQIPHRWTDLPSWKTMYNKTKAKETPKNTYMQ